MRDRLKNGSYWLHYFYRKSRESWIANQRLKSKRDYDGHYLTLLFARVSTNLERAKAAYSVGFPIVLSRDYFLRAVQCVSDELDFIENYMPGKRKNKVFTEAYDLLSLAVLLGLTRDESLPIKRYVDLYRFDDAVLDYLLIHLGHSISNPSSRVNFKNHYQELHDAISAGHDEATQYLKRYITWWYKRSGGKYWHGTHEDDIAIYFGYWCFEAAALAKILRVQNKELREHKYYPSELDDFAPRQGGFSEAERGKWYGISFDYEGALWTNGTVVHDTPLISESILMRLSALHAMYSEIMARCCMDNTQDPTADEKLVFSRMYEDVIGDLQTDISSTGKELVYAQYPPVMANRE